MGDILPFQNTHTHKDKSSGFSKHGVKDRKGNKAVIFHTKYFIYDALYDFLLFVQFNKRETQPWRKVTFSKVAGFNLQLN